MSRYAASARLPGGGRAYPQESPAAMLPGRLTVECAQSQGSGVLSGVFTTVHWPDGARAHQVLAAGKHALCRGPPVACHIVHHARSPATVPPAVCGASLAGWPVWDHTGRVWGTLGTCTPVARSNTGNTAKAATSEHLTLLPAAAERQRSARNIDHLKGKCHLAPCLLYDPLSVIRSNRRLVVAESAQDVVSVLAEHGRGGTHTSWGVREF